MNYILSNEQLDRLMKPYWDGKFENTTLGTIEAHGTNNEDWFGFVDPDTDRTILGRPADESDDEWYSWSGYFRGGGELYGLSDVEFRKALLRYLNKRYNLNIRYIY